MIIIIPIVLLPFNQCVGDSYWLTDLGQFLCVRILRQKHKESHQYMGMTKHFLSQNALKHHYPSFSWTFVASIWNDNIPKYPIESLRFSMHFFFSRTIQRSQQHIRKVRILLPSIKHNGPCTIICISRGESEKGLRVYN